MFSQRHCSVIRIHFSFALLQLECSLCLRKRVGVEDAAAALITTRGVVFILDNKQYKIWIALNFKIVSVGRRDLSWPPSTMGWNTRWRFSGFLMTGENWWGHWASVDMIWRFCCCCALIFFIMRCSSSLITMSCKFVRLPKEAEWLSASGNGRGFVNYKRFYVVSNPLKYYFCKPGTKCISILNCNLDDTLYIRMYNNTNMAWQI